jgi:hypothetical protein
LPFSEYKSRNGKKEATTTGQYFALQVSAPYLGPCLRLI